MEIYKKTAFALSVFTLGVLSLWFIYSNDLNSPVIRSDGEGYYAYLPAVFIYDDITLRTVVHGPLKHKPPQGAYLWNGTNKYLLRYPCGEAILLAPFFLIGNEIAILTKVQADGYSPPYQYAAAFSGLFYCIAGLLLLWRVLKRYFKAGTILIILTVLLFGTNLFHYATYDSIFSHVYSFFLFSAFLLYVERCFYKKTLFDYILLGVIAGLITITRTVNIIWIIMGITYGICSFNDIVARLNSLKQQWKKLLFALISFLVLISIQLIYWKLITGSFFIYSYDKGTFNFTNPEIKNVLFSVRKGLFFWTPVLITIIPGISYIRRNAGYYFFPILIYFPLSIYIISSWSYWWYGGSFGQRPFVESMPIFSIALCSLYEGISKTGKQILVAFMLTSCLYTTWLMLKYWLGIIHYDETTWEYFRSTFFKIQFP